MAPNPTESEELAEVFRSQFRKSLAFHLQLHLRVLLEHLRIALAQELRDPSLMHAQTTTGTISGLIEDPSEGFIQNATVAISDKATGLLQTVHTQSSGEFSSPALPAGVSVAHFAHGHNISHRWN